MIRISVKGNQAECEKVLKDRNIEATFIAPSAWNSGSFFDVDEKYRSQLVHWYCETKQEDCVPGRGFPVGTLLHHN